MTHICVSKIIIIGSDNGLSTGRHQAIIWTNDDILSIRTLGIIFSEILMEIHTFSFKNMHLQMSSAKWRPFCLGLNVLTWRAFNWYKWVSQQTTDSGLEELLKPNASKSKSETRILYEINWHSEKSSREYNYWIIHWNVNIILKWTIFDIFIFRFIEYIYCITK